MLVDKPTFICLIIATIGILFLMFNLIVKKNKKPLHKIFIFNCVITLIWALALIAQITLAKKLNIRLIAFANFVYIGACFLPVSLLLTFLIYTKVNMKFTFKHLLLFIVPIISLLVLWTNDYHNLFYIEYSTNLSDAVFGSYFIIHCLYSYSCVVISLVLLIRYFIKNIGFFSAQSFLLLVGTLVPTVINIIGTSNIIKMSIYVTPIAYIVSLFCYSLAMFDFKLFTKSPIALHHVVNRISDIYIVLDSDNKIIDFNSPFLKTFRLNDSVRKKDLFDLIKKNSDLNIPVNVIKDDLIHVSQNFDTLTHDFHFASLHKYFLVEITGIENNGKFMGTILLLKDTTQHNKDMQTIRNNQDMLVEKERLASLGQMIGGIAHNLKTPIMSISGAVEGLNDLIIEYDKSIDDPEVTIADHHAIASDMTIWIEKIKTHLGYMSDVITAVKGQAVAFSEDQVSKFEVEELLKMVQILMKHELNSSLVKLNIQNNLPQNTLLYGNINSLVQVVNNIVSNAIQASEKASHKEIDLAVNQVNDKIIISIKDYGCGMPKSVQEALFNKMITTKGKNGTGLGLFMSYSNIKAHFNGDITFASEEGKGTQFDIILPV